MPVLVSDISPHRKGIRYPRVFGKVYTKSLVNHLVWFAIRKRVGLAQASTIYFHRGTIRVFKPIPKPLPESGFRHVRFSGSRFKRSLLDVFGILDGIMFSEQITRCHLLRFGGFLTTSLGVG